MDKTILYDVDNILLRAINNLKNEEVVFIPYIPMDEYRTAIEKLGEWSRDIETNGWDYDFWIKFTINDIKYCLSGSWFYGKYKIYKDKE